LRAGVRRLRDIPLKGRFRLGDGGLERPPIEGEKHLTLFHLTAVLEVNGGQLTGGL
jgi:hypothetical protein